MSAFFYLAAAGYAVATGLFGAHLWNRQPSLLRAARWVLFAALLAQLAFIGWSCTQHLNPLRDVRGALGLCGWLLGTGYLLTTWRSRLAVIGSALAPLSLGLLVVSKITPVGFPAGGETSGALSLLGKVHIALAAGGVAIFGLAGAVAMFYLVQEAALKRKRTGPLRRSGPALTALDQAGRRLILIGFVVFTLALVTGVIWVSRLPQVNTLRPEYIIAVLTWITFAALIVARVTVGLRGRRAALITLAGFLADLAVLVVYMVRRVLGG